jgi:hypothetical protein
VDRLRRGAGDSATRPGSAHQPRFNQVLHNLALDSRCDWGAASSSTLAAAEGVGNQGDLRGSRSAQARRTTRCDRDASRQGSRRETRKGVRAGFVGWMLALAD